MAVELYAWLIVCLVGLRTGQCSSDLRKSPIAEAHAPSMFVFHVALHNLSGKSPLSSEMCCSVLCAAEQQSPAQKEEPFKLSIRNLASLALRMFAWDAHN